MAIIRQLFSVLVPRSSADWKRKVAEERERGDWRERQFDKERLRSADLFTAIETMEADRDRWHDMYFLQSKEHMVAQTMLEQGIENLLRVANHMLRLVNGYRKKLGEDELSYGDVLKGLPSGISDGYRQRLDEAESKLPAPVSRRQLLDALPNRTLDESEK